MDETMSLFEQPTPAASDENKKKGLLSYSNSCPICGVELKPNSKKNKIFCSDSCRQKAVSRRTAMRLGIRPPKYKISKLSNPLYFS
jgi:hypothetical protein